MSIALLAAAQLEIGNATFGKAKGRTGEKNSGADRLSVARALLQPLPPQPYFTTRTIPPVRNILRLDVRLFCYLVFLLFFASPGGGQIKEQGQQGHEVCCVHHLSPPGESAGRVAGEATQIRV
jgi:hypothetical protein